MILSAYNIEGGQADVTISKFPGDVGGMVANVQRWRGQLGLSPGSADEARKSVEMVEVGGKKDSYMVDLKGTNVRTGKPARMVAIGVPFQGDTWFFKLQGDEGVVEKEKEKFLCLSILRDTFRGLPCADQEYRLRACEPCRLNAC